MGLSSIPILAITRHHLGHHPGHFDCWLGNYGTEV